MKTIACKNHAQDGARPRHGAAVYAIRAGGAARALCALLIAMPVALWGQCPGFPNCVYTPAAVYEVEEPILQVLRYTDVMGRPRAIEVAIRIPDRQGPLPVIIWAHGGGEGRNVPGTSDGALQPWSEITARAGYLTVTPSFHARNEADHAAMCEYLGIEVGSTTCSSFTSVLWDRPFDMKAIMDALERANRSGPLRGRIDMSRLAIGGHSAGSTGVLAVGGMQLEINGKRYGGLGMQEDPRPKAIVALSCAAPGSHSLFDVGFRDAHHSWENITRPVLFATGAGDAHEQAPKGRRIPYEYAPKGNKFRLWWEDVSVGHANYGDELDACNSTAANCAQFRATVVSAVLAFFDAYVLQRQQAVTYLNSDGVAQVGRGKAEWVKK